MIGKSALPQKVSRWLSRERYRVLSQDNWKAFVNAEGDPAAGRVALIDVDSPGNTDELLELLPVAAANAVTAVVLATQPKPADVVSAMKIGVSDFLIKPVEETALYAAIQAAAAESSARHKRKCEASLMQRRYRSLTHDESLVVHLVSAGRRNHEAAKILDISERTVRTRRYSALRKLAVDSVPKLVDTLVLLGVDQPEPTWTSTPLRQRQKLIPPDG